MAAMRAYDDKHESSYEEKLAELLCDNIVWTLEDHDGLRNTIELHGAGAE